MASVIRRQLLRTTLKTFLTAFLLVLLLFAVSLFVGASDSLSWRNFQTLVCGDSDQALLLLVASRLPRALALVLAGASMAVAGAIMQMLAQNRFVEPSTAGTVESAALGMLLTLLFAPQLPVVGKMLVAMLFAFVGTLLFLAILRRIPLRSPVVVPLVGIMLGGIVSAITSFIAYRYEMMQSLGAWMSGDFSTILRSRYELLWLAGGLTVIAYVFADRLTVAGMGEERAVNLGLNYRRVVFFGLALVAAITASVLVTAGVVPFLGLVVPNLVRLWRGDRLRSSLSLVALIGAGLVIGCDILGRTINAPFEIPVGTVLGVVGSIAFLFLLTGRRTYAA